MRGAYMSGDVLSAALAGINVAIEAGKALVSSQGAIERAELKLKLADIVSALAEAKLDLAQGMDDRRFLQDRIRSLEDALRIKETVVRVGDAYYGRAGTGEPKGAPYCSHCWEKNHQLIHLTSPARAEQHSSCPACKSQYPRNTTHER